MIGSFYAKLFLVALFFKVLIESLLEKRNYNHILKNRNEVPERFKKSITLDDHQKAADYAIAKINASQVFHLINLILFILLTLGGGIELLTRISLTFQYSDKISGLIFFAFLGIGTSIIALPESLYYTFVLEEKFGFNKTTFKTFVADMLKGFLLAIILGGPIVFGILTIMEKLTNLWWLYSFIFLTALQLLIVFIYPTWIAPLFNKFTPLEDGEIKNVILNLLSRVDFKASGLYIMDASKRSSHGNAYFTGFGKNKRIVFFDTLINTLDPYEIEAVLAHELGHMKRKHVLKGMLKSFMMSFLGFYILGILKENHLFFAGHGVATITNANTLTLFSMVAGTYTFLLTPVSSFFSRKYEYEADEFASKFSSSQKLISALVKMYNDNKSFILPDPIYSKFYYSHPPAMERVKYLEELNT